jgi:hypothetical protein
VVSVPRNYLDRPVPVISAGTLARRIALIFATRRAGPNPRTQRRPGDPAVDYVQQQRDELSDTDPEGYEAAQNLPRIGRRGRRCLAGGRINSESAKAGIDSESR